MKKIIMFYKISFCFSLLFVSLLHLDAQITFKLEMLEEEQMYQVSVISEESILAPLNVISTGQVTLKATHGSLEIGQVYNLYNDVNWEPNSISRTPAEAPDFDYISFGLTNTGIKSIEFEKGKEIPLFRFTNLSECTGKIMLIDNQKDPFLPPNSLNVNIGNSLTILGVGGDAYKGNHEVYSVSCASQTTSIKTLEKDDLQLSLFPNPTIEKVAVQLQWDHAPQAAFLYIKDINGQSLIVKEVQLTSGENNLETDVQELSTGSYLLQLAGKNWQLEALPFIKTY